MRYRVEEPVLDEVTRDRRLRGEHLPFLLARQPRTGPVRERVGFVEADVTNGLVERHLSRSAERERPPGSVLTPPVERRPPALRPDDRPSVRQPELRPLISPVVDELDELAVRDGTRAERERLDEHAVARRFVVEREAFAV